MTTDITALADTLQAKGHLPNDWDEAFRSVLRERFIPDRIWVDEHDDGHDVALDRASEPQRRRAAVYSNRVIVTQFDDGDTVWPDVGYRPTSSCSMPSAVLGMLDALDVRAGMRVLEIGTGTGYNAALLAARLGDEQVATVEVDALASSNSSVSSGAVELFANARRMRFRHAGNVVSRHADAAAGRHRR
ncbi:MAG: hypothetical protein ACRDQI_09100 [Pseudonocardiaceae bacterium]